MPARRILLIAGLTAILGAALSPAQATVQVPETYGVTFEAQDEYGNRVEARAYWHRIADPNSSIDRYIIECTVNARPGPSVFPNVSVAAAVGINPSDPTTPAATDGCYLTLDTVPVLNAPGIGASGEAAATSSLESTGVKYYVHDSRDGGEFKACFNVRGLFTNGGLVDDGRCGNQPLGV